MSFLSQGSSLIFELATNIKLTESPDYTAKNTGGSFEDPSA
jgi:hypothetical protein